MAKLIYTNKGNLEVKKADVIVKARYKLNPLALKFITTLIAGIKRGDYINEEYIFKVKDFKELAGLKRKDIYGAIKDALQELLEKPLYIPEETGFILCNWISGGHYVENAGEIRFMIYPKLRPYLLEAQKKFLKYRLENILSLKSSYAIRLYEILKDWLELNTRYGNKAEKIISVEELREILEIPKSYVYGMLKKRILEKAKQELIKYTDILFDYTEIKSGRKITHIKFKIYPNFRKLQKKKTTSRYFNSLANFVALLRKNYTASSMFWGFENDKWIGLDNKGLMLAVNFNDNSHIKTFNAIESQKIYEKWFKIAQHSSVYQEILQEKICIKQLLQEDKHMMEQLQEDISMLKSLGEI